MKLQGVVLMGLMGLSSTVCAQEILCPNSGMPMSQDPGCVKFAPPDEGESQSQQASSQPSGYWEKTWGAIAADGKNGILGTAVGAKSETEAKRIALADCRAKGGGCQVELAYRNQCAVLVTGDKVYNAVSSESIERATSLSMKECKSEDSNCRVYYSACTEPIYHQY